MPHIQENVSLKPYNTFGIDVQAKLFTTINSKEEFLSVLPIIQKEKYLILGMGSNILLKSDFDGIVVLNHIKGMELDRVEGDHCFLSGYSGELWHEFVMWTLDNHYYGMENMSLIPGTLGAAPIQNIGAYGIELKDICLGLDAIDLKSGASVHFSQEDCRFGYRDSVFKGELKGQYFIYKIYFKLSRTQPINMNYGTIKQELENAGITHPSHRDISNAVIAIRRSKLPDFEVLGNAGSFFKNPVLEREFGVVLKTKHPDMPVFQDPQGTKIPAGWLIEKAGFKGKRIGNTGCHKDQALVIVNYGGATGQEIYHYSTLIIDAVYDLFGITLEREVNIIES